MEKLSSYLNQTLSYNPVMKKLSEYLREKKIKTINITNLVNKKTYFKYLFLAAERPTTLLYFKKNKENDECFKLVQAAEETNYFFINKDNYLTTIVNEMDDDLKRCIDKFLELTNELIECMVCYEKSLKTAHCNTCFYGLCNTCLIKILKPDKIVNSIMHYKYDCPNCRQCTKGVKFEMKN